MRAALCAGLIGAGSLGAGLLDAGPAWSHGINGHVHVTGWAIERLPPGELAAFFDDPALVEVAQFAASFPDSGYAIDDPYGEMAHWPPFLEAHLSYLRAEVGPPFETDEARRHAAFVLGLACHGLQDEIFDSIFLFHALEHDGIGQDGADPGTDAFLHTDGYLRFKPAQWAPVDALIEVFAGLGHAVDAETLDAGMYRVKFLVIDNFAALAPRLDREWRPQMPWTAAHYVDPAVPGSLAAEIPATAAFLEAVWARLHGRFPAAAFVGHPYPDGARRLRSADADSASSWVTLVLGIGARVGTVTPDRVEWVGPAGPVPFELRHTRWSGGADDWTRIIQLRPAGDLAPDTEYTVRIAPGIELIDGSVLEGEWAHVFRTPCAPEAAAECPPEPTDGGIPVVDAAVPDAGVDEPLDAEAPDAEPADSGSDAAAIDVAVGAEAPVDRGAMDATLADAGGGSTGGGGDGCAAARARGARGGVWGWLVLLVALGWARRSAHRG